MIFWVNGAFDLHNIVNLPNSIEQLLQQGELHTSLALVLLDCDVQRTMLASPRRITDKDDFFDSGTSTEP